MAQSSIRAARLRQNWECTCTSIDNGRIYRRLSMLTRRMQRGSQRPISVGPTAVTGSHHRARSHPTGKHCSPIYSGNGRFHSSYVQSPARSFSRTTELSRSERISTTHTSRWRRLSMPPTSRLSPDAWRRKSSGGEQVKRLKETFSKKKRS